MKVPRLLRPIFKGFAVLVIFGVLGTALVLGSLWLEHRGEVTLPTPTGPFAVGRAVYDWADDGAVNGGADPGTWVSIVILLSLRHCRRMAVHSSRS